MVAASSQTEKSQWMEDITETVQVDTLALHRFDDSYWVTQLSWTSADMETGILTADIETKNFNI